ncbi:MAG TPA: HdeD family acid-resistance protein [Anaerolineaceae bacterium]|nr:HdeD family acid-resistance protein [Anaerolineaceae bacterium]
MFSQILSKWWLVALRGLLAVICGILALIWPKPTLLFLVLLFGSYMLVDGIFTVITGIAARGSFKSWWAVLLEGMAGILIGLLTFIWPNTTALVLLYLIAAWAMITGIFEIMAAIEFRSVIDGEWAMIFSGILSILFGVLLIAFPSAGAVGLLSLFAIYTIVSGILLMILSMRLRRLRRVFETPGAYGY